jgi:hypothetical protein
MPNNIIKYVFLFQIRGIGKKFTQLFATFLLAISRIFLDSLEIRHKILSSYDTKIQIFGRKCF